MATTQVSSSVLKDGSVTSAKLDTNIAIDGNLTVDTNTLFVDSANNRVGIGTASPALDFEINKDKGAGSATYLSLRSNDTGIGVLLFGNQSDAATASISYYSATQHLQFNGYNNAERMRIDSSGRVGIGITSPNSYDANADNLVIGSTGANDKNGITIVGGDTDGRGAIYFADTTQNSAGYITYLHSNNSMLFGTSDSTAMTITSSGNVGIGTASPISKLDIANNMRITSGSGAQKLLMGNQDSGGTNNPSIIMAANGNFWFGGGNNWSAADGGTMDYAMTLLDNGNVGIGTTSPADKLHVYGDMIVGGNGSDAILRFWETNNGWNIRHVASGNRLAMSNVLGGTDHFNITEAGNVGIGTTSPSSMLHLESASSPVLTIKDTTNNVTLLAYSQDSDSHIGTYSNHPLIFDTNSAERMRIAASGNVGIGTTSPAYKLDVNGDAYISLNDSLYLGNANSRITSNSSSDILYFPNRDHVFGSVISGADVERMRITEAGKVGIGTTSPSQKLTVRDDSTSAYPITLENVNIGTPGVHTGIRFGYINNTYQKGAIIFEGQDSSGRGKMFFAMEATANSANADETDAKMTIDYSGNVGIGTTSPGAKLHVVGDIVATGDVTAYYSSDERLKENKKIIENATDKIEQISGYEFDWIAKEGVHINEGHDVGVMAQEVEKILPEVVTTRENGYKAVKYEKLVPLLIESIKELSGQIKELRSQINI